MVNIDRIISENINKYIRKNVIKESEFNYIESNPTQDLIEYIKGVGNINLSINNDKFDFETRNYDWTLMYNISSNAVADEYPSLDYDVPSSVETKYEDEWDFDSFELYCYTKDGEEVPFTVSEEIVSAFKSISNVDYNDYQYPDSSIYR